MESSAFGHLQYWDRIACRDPASIGGSQGWYEHRPIRYSLQESPGTLYQETECLLNAVIIRLLQWLLSTPRIDNRWLMKLSIFISNKIGRETEFLLGYWSEEIVRLHGSLLGAFLIGAGSNLVGTVDWNNYVRFTKLSLFILWSYTDTRYVEYMVKVILKIW